jgi:hypothetical protein
VVADVARLKPDSLVRGRPGPDILVFCQPPARDRELTREQMLAGVTAA